MLNAKRVNRAKLHKAPRYLKGQESSYKYIRYISYNKLILINKESTKERPLYIKELER